MCGLEGASRALPVRDAGALQVGPDGEVRRASLAGGRVIVRMVKHQKGYSTRPRCVE